MSNSKALAALRLARKFMSTGAAVVEECRQVDAAIAELEAEQAGSEPIGYIPGDALAQLAPPRVRLLNVPISTYDADGTVPIYTAPPPQAAEALDAKRYRKLVRQFRVMSLDMGGRHCWVQARSTALVGPNIDAAVDALPDPPAAMAEGGE